MQRLEVPQFLFIARAVGHSVMQQSMVLDLAVMAAVKGLFDAFSVIFRAPLGRPGVERQFLEPSMVKSSSPSRAPFAN